MSITIRIFLVHGDPKRLRTAEISNWTGKAIAGPRNEFAEILAREESANAGVYFLAGNDPETGKAAIYIGEAEVIRDRIRAHLEKDFWNQIVCFISKDQSLTKAHILYLEGRLIDQARQAGRAEVKNAQKSGTPLPESDRADMEAFLEKIIQLLPILGVELLVPVSIGQPDEREILLYKVKGLTARGYRSPNGFVVLKDSQAVLSERPSASTSIASLRTKLKEEGALVEKDGYFLFSKDVEFSSPSAAAAVVCGGHANGLVEWKNKQGKTLKEMEARQ